SPVFYFTYNKTEVRQFFQNLDSPNPATQASAAPSPAATPNPATTSSVTIPPSAMKVSVLNGSPVRGVAIRFANTLTKDGYVVGTVANAPRGTTDQTEVRYSADEPGAAAAAAVLAARVDGAVAVADRDLSAGTYQFIIGTDTASTLTGGTASATP